MTKNLMILSGLVCLTAFAPVAHAADDYTTAVKNGEITSGRSDERPGSLTAHDVMGKRLLDSEGNLIGQIEGVSKDGRFAIVSGAGGKMQADMTTLSLGMGANTVIAQQQSRANSLNAASSAESAARDEASRQSGSSSVTVEQPATRTTTTVTNSEHISR